jgi:hypothetical protein
VLTALFLLYFSATERAAPVGTPEVLDLELAFTAARFNGIVDQWAEAGTLGVQQRNLWLDLFLPLAYAGLLTGLLVMLALLSSGEPRPGLSKASVYGRPAVIVCLVLLGMTQPVLILFGAIDLLAAIWTGLALRSSR